MYPHCLVALSVLSIIDNHECRCYLSAGVLASMLCETAVLSIKVAREGRDKIFTFSFWCIFGANNFFSSKFSGKGVGAMPYLLTNFWSRDSLYDGFLNI